MGVRAPYDGPSISETLSGDMDKKFHESKMIHYIATYTTRHDIAMCAFYVIQLTMTSHTILEQTPWEIMVHWIDYFPSSATLLPELNQCLIANWILRNSLHGIWSINN